MDDYTELTGIIIGAAREVHSHWGSGLIESIYEKSLRHELSLRNVEVRRQVKLQLKYKDLELDDDYALDLIVDERVQSWTFDQFQCGSTQRWYTANNASSITRSSV